MTNQYKVVYDLSNGAIFNDLERPLPPVSMSRHSLTLNVSETVRHTDIVSMKYLYGLTYIHTFTYIYLTTKGQLASGMLQ